MRKNGRHLYNSQVLLFELFPAFLAVVSVVVAIGLYAAERRARRDPSEQVRRPTPPPRQASDAPPERPGRRPSMAP